MTPELDRSARPLRREQIEAVLRLPGPDRYAHFIKQVADTEKVWSLRDADGWVCSSTEDGQDLFPLWPHRDYALLAAVGPWAEAAPQPIDLEMLMSEMLPRFASQGVHSLIFPTPDDRGVVPELPQLLSDLKTELQRYE